MSGEAEPTPVGERLKSLDAYRGLIMISLAFEGFGLRETAQRHLREDPDSSLWATVYHQFEHVEWVGCGYWDLIQPSFMFMVGVSMAYSYLKRQRLGQSYARMAGHAAWRSVVLIFLGIFLISNWSSSTEWSLMNVLSQIGLGYFFLFLLWGKSTRTQAITAALLLVGTWLLYIFGPGHALEAAPSGPGVSEAWASEHLEGVDPAWHKNANAGHVIDVWLLNQLPQEEPFAFNRGGYQTINFIPSLATMLFGLMCGELLRSDREARRKLQILAAAAVGGWALGLLLNYTGLCPIVKRIWTPSWALFSAGWCCAILAALYGAVDVLKYRRWAFPLVVVGVNSIAMYCMAMLLKGWVQKSLTIHFGEGIFLWAGPLWEPALRYTLTGLCFWLVCFYLYRNKLFLRI